MPSRKAVKKTTKKTVARKVSRPSRSSSQGLFAKHPNLTWMLPLLVILLGVFFVIHHFRDEASAGEGMWKEEVKNAIHLDTDDGKEAVLTVTPSPTDNSTITPYVTVAPTVQQ